MMAMSTQLRFASPTARGRPTFPEPGQGPLPELARVPVLVIEDEAMIAWMLESLLQDMGFEAITLASNATEAAAAAARETPELVISDINLGPGADGIEAVAEIRHACSAAVVFVSAFIDEVARGRISEQVGGARVLSKPLGSAELLAVIRDALAGC